MTAPVGDAAGTVRRMSWRHALGIALFGSLPVAVLGLVLGNPFVSNALMEAAATDAHLLNDVGLLRFVAAIVHPDIGLYGEPAGLLDLIAFVVGYVITLGGLFGLLYLGARAVDPERGSVAMLLIGWGSLTVAAGVGRLPSAIAASLAVERGLWHIGLSSGTLYGLVLGWVVGLVAMLVYRKFRTTATGPGPVPRSGPAGPPGAPPPGGQPPPCQPPPGQVPPGQYPPSQPSPNQRPAGQPSPGQPSPGSYPGGQPAPGQRQQQPGQQPPGQQQPGEPSS